MGYTQATARDTCYGRRKRIAAIEGWLRYFGKKRRHGRSRGW